MVDYLFRWIPGKRKVWYRPFIKSWGLMIKALVIVAILLVLKWFIDHYNLNFIPMGALITAFLSGVFFTISILFAGAMSDYKESEKIPGELAVSVKTLYKDTSIMGIKDKELLSRMQTHILGLLETINSNFRRNVWKLKEIDKCIDDVTNDIREAAEAGVAPGYITKMRSELSMIDRFSHRIDVIEETTFIPAAYTLAQVAISTLLFMLLFIKMDSQVAGMILIGAVSTVLISLVLLIKDMDNPFEVNKNSYADVDFSILFNLEEYLKSIAPKKKK